MIRDVTNRATELTFSQITPGAPETIAVLALSRPDAANSFNDDVIRELVAHVAEVGRRQGVRAMILCGRGKHFSAGADLTWMKASAELSVDDNRRDAQNLTALFEGIVGLRVPTVAVVHGSAFGGAVGLAACCDLAVAAESARFSLSEIKLGLMPAVILPYLMRKVRPGSLRRHALTGRVFSASEALTMGLVERVVAEAELARAVREELDLLLQGSPTAQAKLKDLMDHVLKSSFAQTPTTADGIAALRAGPSGQAGLTAFFAKAPPPWAAKLPEDWTY